MPAPVSSNSSVYDPAPQPNDTCDPSNASCPPPPSPAVSQAPRVVTLEPVVVEGSLSGELVRQFSPNVRIPPSCKNETWNAVISCADAGLVMLKELIRHVPPISEARGALAGARCGKDLRILYDCKKAP